MTWVSFVDESMRQRHDGTGIYVLAAVMFDRADTAEVVATARGLALGGRRFHWRDESPARRRKAVSAVAECDALHIAIVGTSLDLKRQERGRRQCLSRMLWELSDAGVGQAWIDSRRPHQDQLDVKLVDALRARSQVGDDLRLKFVKSADEPLAWLPDIVAGAVSAARGDGDEQYFTVLEPQLIEHRIELY